jgi:hypothetical protein
VAGLLAILVAAPAAAEVDVVAALGGRWEGKTEVQSPRYRPERVLVLRNLRLDSTQGDVAKWLADGLYGTPELQGRVAVTVTVVGGQNVFVEFMTPESLHVELKLLKPTLLEGTHKSGSGLSRRLRLDRSP